MKLILAAISLCLLPAIVIAEAIYQEFPTQIEPDEKYVFYSHGLLVEGTDETPIHPEYGRYDFPAIRQKLLEIGGFNLIAYHRPSNTDIAEYADLLESWVVSLIASGVGPLNITLIGFSRGAHITALSASQLRSYEINTVLIASCLNGDIEADPPLILSGRLLSIYESTDNAGPCEKLASRSQLTSFDEISISIGEKHGAFYTPLDNWMNPIKEWLQRNDS